jgi:hypothetical protein
MEIRDNNFNGREREAMDSDERLEGFAAAEMADRGPKDVIPTAARNTDTDAAAIRQVSNPGGEEGDEDYDDEDDDTDELIGDDVDDTDVDDADIDDVDLDDEDLDDIDLDDDDEDEEDDTL